MSQWKKLEKNPSMNDSSSKCTKIYLQSRLSMSKITRFFFWFFISLEYQFIEWCYGRKIIFEPFTKIMPKLWQNDIHWQLFFIFFLPLSILLFDSKETIYFIIFPWWKVQKLSFTFYLHFTWLCGSWKLQRILKKYWFWKCESWFPFEVAKLISANYPLKWCIFSHDFYHFNQYFLI